MKPGDLLASKFRLERVLGSGAMGKVWAAVNESTGRPVAIKLMHLATPALRARMLREARAVGTLKHRNIVDLYDVGETEGGDPFLVMERLSGETLDDRLERGGRLPPARAVEIVTSIAAALRVAHASGIVHRDLKPANVFLHRDEDGGGEIVKVVDFGVSKHLRDTVSTLTTGLVGSPCYMSPEQARAEPDIDARSDLWSLGVVLFQMLAGHRPFDAGSPYVVISEVVTGPIPSIAEAVPGLSTALVQVVERCLTRDVDARIGSADELIRLLGTSVDVDPKGEEEPARRQEAAPLSVAPTTKTTLAEEGAAIVPVGKRLRSGPVPGRGPSNAVVALITCASALLLIVAFGAALHRASPTAATATAAVASMDPGDDGTATRPRPKASGEAHDDGAASGPIPQAAPPEATTTVASSIPQPVATTAPETPASSASSAAAHPQSLPRTHRSGEKRLVLP